MRRKKIQTCRWNHKEKRGGKKPKLQKGNREKERMLEQQREEPEGKAPDQTGRCTAGRRRQELTLNWMKKQDALQSTGKE